MKTPKHNKMKLLNRDEIKSTDIVGYVFLEYKGLEYISQKAFPLEVLNVLNKEFNFSGKINMGFYMVEVPKNYAGYKCKENYIVWIDSSCMRSYTVCCWEC